MTTLRGELRTCEPLRDHTSWRVGGPADRFYRPADRNDLSDFLKRLPANERLLWVGLGSNLLVRDAGFRGTAVCTHGVMSSILNLGDGRVWAEAGVHCARLAKTVAGLGLAGGEFFAGIPGTLGGALAMNAGAWGGETWSVVESANTVSRTGEQERRSPSQFTIGYRSVEMPSDDLWFVGATLAFKQDEDGRAAERIRTMLAERRAAQPVGQPSCGSVFRNPPGDHAARLIEAAGLKGHAVGGAQVSDKHANFILNTGQASAADIEALMNVVQARVEQQFGISLIAEVRVVGDAPGVAA